MLIRRIHILDGVDFVKHLYEIYFNNKRTMKMVDQERKEFVFIFIRQCSFTKIEINLRPANHSTPYFKKNNF